MVVRGALVIIARDAGLLVVNDLDLEAYVKSVVPSEVPVTWPFEALKAQAIVARTFALHKKGERGGQAFDVDATVQSQVYGGLGSEDPRASEAVDATAGIVVMHEGRLALTPYHSTSAGPTEDAAEVWGIDLPYLKGVACPFDEDSSVYRWERRLSFDAIESALREAGYAVGSIATLTPLGRNRSGRVSAVRILHSEGELILKGELLRRIIGYQRVPSMRFDVVDVEAEPHGGGFDVRLRGGGWGHGVGLCQWGMKTLSERGWTADRIIDYYYPGTNLDDAARRPKHIR
jgi:stage II sporulation protein D